MLPCSMLFILLNLGLANYYINGNCNVAEIPPGKFKNPVMLSAPDPWVVQKDGFYYFTHTTGRNITLYRTNAMSDLAEAESKVV